MRCGAHEVRDHLPGELTFQEARSFLEGRRGVKGDEVDSEVQVYSRRHGGFADADAVGVVSAVPPVEETFHIEETWFFEDCADFQVWEDFRADVRFSHHYVRDGNLIRTIGHWTGTGEVYNNSNDDLRLQEKIVHNTGFYDESDEMTFAAGRFVHIVLPGEGTVFIAVGRVYDCQDAVCIGVSGHNDWVSGDKDKLCAALRGP
jgi:hypothetical protein